MLNPEYADLVDDSVKVGFTVDGERVLEIELRKQDAHRLGMMLIQTTKRKR